MIAQTPAPPANTLAAGCTEIHVSSFGYDAAENRNGARRQVATTLMSEDAVLDKSKRKKSIAGARDMFRNFAIAAWAVRKHLDYTTQFTFQCRTKDKDFNREMEKKVAQWSARGAFDIANRHALPRFIRLMECRAVVDHDVGIVRLKSGHVQAIESDRIQTPPDVKTDDWTQGVKTNAAGAALQYGVYNRGPGGKGYDFARTVPADNFWLHGYFDHFDQYRGISPVISAINSMRDVYEGIDFGLAKLKVEQMFALAFFRDASAAPPILNPDEEPPEVGGYEVKLDGSPMVLDMDPGDKAQFMKSDAPGGNTVAFLQAVIAIALKSLDIPYSFYDESFTNFFGSRAAWQHYERSCKDKRARIVEFLQWWTKWEMSRAILANGLKLPAGLSIADEFWEWVPDGMPWWDPVKEINGDNMAIKGGFTTPQKVVKARGGGDFYDNVDAIAEAVQYAADKGVALDYATLAEPVTIVGSES